MPRQQEPQFQNAIEEIGYLRQRFGSLAMRGQYKECFKLVEDNIKLLYFGERWPENFIISLKSHKRCYASMDINQSYDEYLTVLLKKNDIPVMFVNLMKQPDKSVDWSSENFKNLALEAKEQGKSQEALDYCQIMAKVDPLSSNCYLIKGKILEDMKQDAAAAEAYQHALEINENNYQAWKCLAEYHAKTSITKALEFINKAVEMAPSEAEFHAVKAELLGKSGNMNDAMAAIDKAITLEPLNAEFLYEKGELLLKQEQTLSALRQFTQAAALDARHVPSLLRLSTLLAAEQPEKALPCITAVVMEQPENIDAMLLRARLLRKTGDIDNCQKQYARIIELDPSCAKAYAGLGRIYFNSDAKQALRQYERAVQLDEKNAQYRLGKAQALEHLQQAEAAEKEYHTVLELDKNVAKAHAALGRLSLEENPQQAAKYFSRAAELDKGNSYYHEGKGDALLKQGEGKLTEAVACLSRAVQYDPGNAPLRMRIAQLLEKMGNVASAAEHYRVAMGLDPRSVAACHGLARVLTEHEPHRALEAINKALVLSTLESELYYRKSVILDLLATRQESLLKIKDAVSHNAADNGEVVQELNQVLKGESYILALTYVNRAIEHAPGNSSYLCARARMLHNMGSTVKAMDQYNKVLKLDPQNHEALFGVGRIQAAEKDPKALATLEKAILLAPSIPVYHAEKARLLAGNLQTRRDALAEYDVAIELGKEQWWVILEKAKLLDEFDELAEAQQHYRRVLLANPDCLEATARMGMMLEDLNRPAALNYTRRAVELDPENAVYHAWMARIYYNAGETDKAEEECHTALKLAGNGHEANYKLAGVLWEKQPDIAHKYIAKALDEFPDEPAYYLLQGQIYELLGEVENSAVSFRRVLTFSDGYYPAMAKLAGILFELHDPDCLHFIEQALRLDPQNPAYLYTKASIVDEMKDNPTAAVELISVALRGDPGNILYQEKLVELLEKNKNRFRGFIEKGKLEKFRRQRQKAEQAAKVSAQNVDPPPQSEGSEDFASSKQ